MATGTFTYRRGIAPMMWVLVVLASVELVVGHLVLAHWWPRVTPAVSLVTLTGVLRLVWAIRSFDRLPVLVEEERVVLRVDTLHGVVVSWADVAGMWLDDLGGFAAALERVGARDDR